MHRMVRGEAEPLVCGSARWAFTPMPSDGAPRLRARPISKFEKSNLHSLVAMCMAFSGAASKVSLWPWLQK